MHTPQIYATVAAFLQTPKSNLMSFFLFFVFLNSPWYIYQVEKKDLSDNAEPFLLDCHAHIHMHQQKSAATRQNVQFHCVDVFASLSSAFHCKVSELIYM